MKIQLEEDYPEYDSGPCGGDILEVISYNESAGIYYCKFDGCVAVAIYDYEVIKVIEEN